MKKKARIFLILALVFFWEFILRPVCLARWPLVAWPSLTTEFEGILQALGM